ncbi:hypothetical protein AWC17_03270 [Mycobacterium nebraskense]|uniref:Uncharacterized protein n=1 Tax=Mycobacterium nebraskense TaxID=244292 RepID=A0A1X1ZMG0_9MYCO|nr:hypothetical protein [Mycobacterium nebraskense]ORW24574.1 hypothetical protein AWC17_03270 [Mycobacterium nebraskense]
MATEFSPIHSEGAPWTPINGHTAVEDPAAAAQHSADIADMMAGRCEGHAARAHDSADSAEHYAGLAQLRADAAEFSASRADLNADSTRDAVAQVRHMTHAITMLALGVLIGFLLAVLAYVVMVLVLGNTGPTPRPHNVYDNHVTLPANSY